MLLPRDFRCSSRNNSFIFTITSGRPSPALLTPPVPIGKNHFLEATAGFFWGGNLLQFCGFLVTKAAGGE